MAARPQTQVNVPPAPRRANTGHMNDIPSLSADKALQFTPFTASILPAVDRIPIPEVSRVRENGRVSTSSERRLAQTLLQQQDLQPVIRNKIAALLNRENGTQFDFQLPPTPSPASQAPALDLVDLGLSPLARSILNMSKVAYRYPTPPGENDNDTVVVHTPKKPTDQRLPTPANSISPSSRAKPVQKDAVNSQAAQKQPNGGLVVQIPAPLPTCRRDDYVTIQHSPKRRKVSHDGDAIGDTTTQKQQSDEALHSFQDLLADIFEGQDHIDSLGGNVLNAKSQEYFETFENEAEEGSALNMRTLDKLREAMRKLLSLQRLRDVPVDDLRRLQQICEPSIERAQTTNVRLDTYSDQEQDLWRSRTLRVSNSLGSAIAVIYTMLGNPQQEALLSPDLLRWSANALVNVLESGLIPVIEARPDMKDSTLFKQASSEIESIKLLLSMSRRLLELMATACTDVKGGELCVNTIEFLAAKLVFVQNATTDKNSVLGLQVYEGFRKTAMASLSKMYARFVREREAILDEILSSLDKLPSTSRSARTFRAGGGKSIQLISALFMQLIQTTALHVPDKQARNHKPKARRTKAPDSGDEEMVEEEVSSGEDDENNIANADDAVTRLNLKVSQLFTPAYKEAQKIVLYLVNRASKTTKTGDSPYRSILDLLVEDLLNVLENYEWPSAEILLNVLAVKMLDLAENEKTASAKNMALESLGTMASAISKLRVKSTVMSNSLRPDGSRASAELVSLAQIHAEAGGIPGPDLISLKGPFVMVIEHSSELTGKVTLHQQSARGYFVAYFARLVSDALRGMAGNDLTDVVEHIVHLMTSSISDSQSLGMDVSGDVAEAAYLLCVLNSGFCRRLTAMVKAVSSSFTSDQAQVRSRSLKSVGSILEIDSSLLDRDVTIAEDVFRCASDDSAMVRDSALSLIARFVIPRGGVLQEKGMRRLLDCTGDEKVGVQKRSIGHLKDIYLQEHSGATKKAIILRFLLRLNDHEDSIILLAEQTLQDVLVKPALAHLVADENSATAKVAIEHLSAHLMHCVSEHYLPMLKKFFASLLRMDMNTRNENYRLCSRLVEALFEKVISTEKVESPLLVLTALAEADPMLVPAIHLSKLQIYLDVKPGEPTFMFRSAVGICRLVLPFLPETYKNLLKQTQDNLMKAINKMPGRLELDTIFQCLSTIDGVLHNTERFFVLSKSILTGLQSPETSTDSKVKTVPVDSKVKLVRILGAMGKHLDLDSHMQAFARVVPNVRATSVSAHLALTLLPLTTAERPLVLREVALESVGSICQASPALFNNAKVRTTLFDVLNQSSAPVATDRLKLQAVVLNIFDELYAARAASKEKSDKAEDSDEQALKQMGGTAKSRDQDSAISAITMDVVDAVLRISVFEASSNALPSARTLASISHQGLVHPKQCLGAFVAFGTSTDQEIAAIGHKAQRLLHEQHESHCEREYMPAIAQAFKYQADVGEGPCGALQTGPAGLQAKLAQCFEVITMSNSKYVKKFLSGLVSRTAIDASSSENSVVSLEHVAFTRFVMQNIAFFDYKKMDELLHVVLQLDLAYSKSGGEVAQSVEAAQMQYPDLIVHTQVPGNPELGLEPTTVETKSIDPALILELKRISPAAATLMLMIETRSHLLRQYGISRDVRTAMMNNKQAKETNKNPTKVHGITGEKLWTKSNNIVTSLDDGTNSVQLCKDFVAVMSVDEDFEMADDQQLPVDAAGDVETSMMKMSMTPGGRKRKLSATPGTTPSKRPRGRLRKTVPMRSRSVSTDGDPDADFPG